MRSKRGCTSTASGFTLVESAVGVTLLSVVGYALLLAVDTSNNSRRVVMELASEGRVLRETTGVLLDELAVSSDSTITVSTLDDGNHRVDFQLPIDDGGTAAWGVYDSGLPRSGWQVRYTVVSTSTQGGQHERVLVRQVLDDQGQVQDSTSLMEDLCSGTDDPPGFKMVKSGEVWELTLTTEGSAGGGSGIEEVFHVRARN